MAMEKKEQNLMSAVAAIKSAILQGQYEAAKEVNRVQLAVYFSIGKYLSLNTRNAKWGSAAIETISRQLRKELPGLKGFSATNLKNMRVFYDEWIILDQNSSVATNKTQSIDYEKFIISSDASDEIKSYENTISIHQAIVIPETKEFPVEDFFKVPFSHHLAILSSTKNIKERYYYIHKTAEECLSYNSLKRLIDNKDYEHKDRMPNNFSATLSDSEMARKAVMMFKDEYLLDFINVEEIGERDKEDIDERVVEKGIMQNIKKFIMTFGNDFAFVGNQYHLEIYGVENFPDLLFFNRELNALVVIDLKKGVFKSSYLGQLMTYLSILDTKVRKPNENPSIGIVMCKSANREFVEFVIRDYNKPLGVVTYRTSEEMPEKLRKALPDVEELKKLL